MADEEVSGLTPTDECRARESTEGSSAKSESGNRAEVARPAMN